MECGTDIIPVSFYFLRSQLSFDTNHFMFIYYKSSHKVKCCGFKLKWPLEVTKGQIRGGSLFENDLYGIYKLCTKFHVFIKKCTKRSLGALQYHLNSNPQSISIYILLFKKWCFRYLYQSTLVILQYAIGSCSIIICIPMGNCSTFQWK